jgi:GT2 family glycosyltransferase
MESAMQPGSQEAREERPPAADLEIRPDGRMGPACGGPAVSVVVPTYDCAALLARCLDHLMRQTAPPDVFEVVVVDDGSMDRTPELLAERAAAWPPLAVVRQPNRGPARARNAGIRAARAPIVAFVDSDCEPDAAWVQAILGAFERDPEAVGVEGKTITRPDEVRPFTHQIENLRGGVYCTANVAYRRWVLERVGGFDEDFFYGHEDTDLAIRAGRFGPIRFAPEAVVVHPPVPVSFWKVVSRPKVWKCHVVLYAKHPERYVAGHGRGPFGVLLWHYGVRQLVERVSRFRGLLLTAPLEFLLFLAAMALQRVYMLLYFPCYVARLVELARGRDRDDGGATR